MKKDLKNKKVRAIIVIKNLTVAQSIALEDMMATWQGLGSMGCSRWTSFFADGDGNFRPEISFNGYVPQTTELLEEGQTWEGGEYRIDFDTIGWKLHDNEYIRAHEIKKQKFFRVLVKTIRFFIVWAIEDLVLKIKLYKIRRRSKKCEKRSTNSESCVGPPERYDEASPIKDCGN
jgi:hypothetical protein